MAKKERPFIIVIAGVNGGGKSSLIGSKIKDWGLDWFNPDTYARELSAQTGVSSEEAMAAAWEYSHALLEIAIANGSNHAFETTLGGNTITDSLMHATPTHDLIMLYCGLASPEIHIQRVTARVAHGGHAITNKKIRERWVSSRANVIRLMPYLTFLQVFDNSAEVLPGDAIPDPLLVLEVDAGTVVFPNPNDPIELGATPPWAHALVQAAIDQQQRLLNTPT
jgi:predicted ABC-type ATPase